MITLCCPQLPLTDTLVKVPERLASEECHLFFEETPLFKTQMQSFFSAQQPMKHVKQFLKPSIIQIAV